MQMCVQVINGKGMRFDMFLLVFFSLFLYLETIYHIFGFGFTFMNVLLTLGLCLCAAGIESFFLNLFQKKAEDRVFKCLMLLDVFLYGAHLVYLKIFKQPLLLSAAIHGGADALTDYWKEAVSAVFGAWFPLILMLLPVVLVWKFKAHWESVSRRWRFRQRAQYAAAVAVGILIFWIGLLAGKTEGRFSTDMYEEFGDPKAVFEQYGVLPSMKRNIEGMAAGGKDENAFLELGTDAVENESAENEKEPVKPEEIKEEAVEEKEPEIDTSPNVLPIQFDKLTENEGQEVLKSLHQYVEKRTPTKKNEYTGMFRDYNLIFMTAEGFAPYCVDETITPTLYKLLNTGFQFENYYVPLWHTSTSDGEFANCTGLLPDEQFSFSRSAKVSMPFLLPAFFENEGVSSLAFHNGSLSYYDRYLTHENIGYFFKAGSSGKLPDAQWQEQMFQMENGKLWPPSDLEMMQATMGDYVEQPRFHAYYMTISGHLQYTFAENAMSRKNQDAVAQLPYSEKAKAYIACNVELDKALEYLIEELEKAGKLENTVICFGADHYPYGLEEEEIEELRGTPLEKKQDLYHSGLVLWNAEMEPVKVEKPCSSVDILPTLLNLFGFAYDSRLYSGQDILSDSSPLVVFSDKSFLTDKIYYDARTGTAESQNGGEADEVYIENMKKQVKDLFTFSAGVLDYNYYQTLEEYAPQKNNIE